MERMIIRKVKPEDFEDIFILNLSLGYSYPKEKMKERIYYILKNTKDIILVVVIKQEVVGYIHASPYELMYYDSLLNILGFVVKEEKRGSGIGHKLITELEKQAKERGFSGIRLTSGFNRIEAHKFYEKHGYINRKNQKNFIKTFS